MKKNLDINALFHLHSESTFLNNNANGIRYTVYFIFFLGRKLLVCPHFVLRQLVALG